MGNQPILAIIHPTSCGKLVSSGLFLAPTGDNGLPVEVKQLLSREQSPIRAGKLDVHLFSRVLMGCVSLVSVETLISSSDSSILAASSPAKHDVWSFRALQAFSSIDCRYLPWTSIRSCRRR